MHPPIQLLQLKLRPVPALREIAGIRIKLYYKRTVGRCITAREKLMPFFALIDIANLQ